MHFSGSYGPNDVSFLLNIENFKEISILEKEALIQSGKKHYSEVLTEEMDFPNEYLNLLNYLIDIPNVYNMDKNNLCKYWSCVQNKTNIKYRKYPKCSKIYYWTSFSSFTNKF